MSQQKIENPSRRTFISQATKSIALGSTLASFNARNLSASTLLEAEKSKFPMGKAEHCIFLWLGGGACQIDTFDPKRLGDAKKKIPGSYYPAINTAVKDVQVCEHLKRTAPLLDRAVLLRSVHHNVIDEHAAAVNRMHTGRPTSGTVVYPSIGSIVAHELKKAEAKVPAYILMGYPNLTRGPGFLGAKHSYLYLTDTKSGPPGLVRPPGVKAKRQDRRDRLVKILRDQKASNIDKKVKDLIETQRLADKLAGPQFMSAFDLESEPQKVREGYGSEFGQRCLLARRLIERGVRFVEVAHNLNFINGTGWDTHNEGQLKQHLLIDELDRAFSSLLLDLEEKKILDKTLIVISTEFGRPPGFDGRGGRGHQPGAFTTVLAGGGLKTGQVVGETDELGKKIVKDPVSVPDFFATTFAALKIDPHKELFQGDRPVPITDNGKVIEKLFPDKKNEEKIGRLFREYDRDRLNGWGPSDLNGPKPETRKKRKIHEL